MRKQNQILVPGGIGCNCSAPEGVGRRRCVLEEGVYRRYRCGPACGVVGGVRGMFWQVSSGVTDPVPARTGFFGKKKVQIVKDLFEVAVVVKQ